jgi:hypothetical protein
VLSELSISLRSFVVQRSVSRFNFLTYASIVLESLRFLQTIEFGGQKVYTSIWKLRMRTSRNE